MHNICALEKSVGAHKPVGVWDAAGVCALLYHLQQSCFKSAVGRLQLKLKNLCRMSRSAVSVSASWTSLKKLLSFNKVYTLHVLKKETLLGNPVSCNICK